jgi:hypothetical protein
MLIRNVDSLMNNKTEFTEHHITAYKYGLLLEALEKLKYPN